MTDFWNMLGVIPPASQFICRCHLCDPLIPRSRQRRRNLSPQVTPASARPDDSISCKWLRVCLLMCFYLFFFFFFFSLVSLHKQRQVQRFFSSGEAYRRGQVQPLSNREGRCAKKTPYLSRTVTSAADRQRERVGASSTRAAGCRSTRGTTARLRITGRERGDVIPSLCGALIRLLPPDVSSSGHKSYSSAGKCPLSVDQWAITGSHPGFQLSRDPSKEVVESGRIWPWWDRPIVRVVYVPPQHASLHSPWTGQEERGPNTDLTFDLVTR